MTEADLKSALVGTMRQLLAGFEIHRHEDRSMSGLPDITVTGYGWTTWWEAKHGTPDFKVPGVQGVVVGKLGAAGYARYILFLEDERIRRVIIAHPDDVFDRKLGKRSYEWRKVVPVTTSPLGTAFSYTSIARHIRDVHVSQRMGVWKGN